MYNNSMTDNRNYSGYSQLDFDAVRLKGLGFSDIEIRSLGNIIMGGGKLSTQAFQSYGFTYEQSKRMRYMVEICSGRVSLDSTDDLSKHLRKIYGGTRRIGIEDLAVSKVNKVPRVAVIAGIPEGPFDIWNSKQYSPTDGMYNVLDVTSKNIIIETSIIPVLKYKQDKFIDDVLEIKGKLKNGNLAVAINRKYCKLVNRFIIVASLRRPEFHHGMAEIICIEGTKVYVYAKSLGTTEDVKYNFGTQRVYRYGFLPTQIKDRLTTTCEMLYTHLSGRHIVFHSANQEFRRILPEKPRVEEEIEVI